MTGNVSEKQKSYPYQLAFDKASYRTMAYLETGWKPGSQKMEGVPAMINESKGKRRTRGVADPKTMPASDAFLKKKKEATSRGPIDRYSQRRRTGPCRVPKAVKNGRCRTGSKAENEGRNGSETWGRIDDLSSSLSDR
jgi:hypothetical protein